MGTLQTLKPSDLTPAFKQFFIIPYYFNGSNFYTYNKVSGEMAGVIVPISKRCL